MKKNFYHLTMALTTVAALAACQPQKSAISFEHQVIHLLLFTSQTRLNI